MAVRVDKDNDRVEESAVNDGVVIVDVAWRWDFGVAFDTIHVLT
jgi:hypothetical protein